MGGRRGVARIPAKPACGLGGEAGGDAATARRRVSLGGDGNAADISNGGDAHMKPDSRDAALLRLTGKYRWLPFDAFERFGLGDAAESAAALSKLGYISIARSRRYLGLTKKGMAFLDDGGYGHSSATNRPYAGSVTLRRRLEAASIMLTALRAGIGTLGDGIDSLRGQPAFMPSHAFRTAEANPMSNVSCAGYGRWGGKAYMLHYAGLDGGGMFLNNELRTFHSLSSATAPRFDEPEAMIFAGEGYRQVYGRLVSAPSQSPSQPPKNYGAKSYVNYPYVYSRVEIPIHILACSEIGAMQLALTRQPDFAARLARAAFGDRWTPEDGEIPDGDGLIDGNRAILIAADMDIRRAVRVIDDARRFGRKGVALIAFREQIEELLMPLFPRDGFVTHLRIGQPALDAAFGKSFHLCSLEDAQEGGGADA